MTMREQLIEQIEACAEHLGIKPSTLSFRIFGDGGRYSYYKNGGGITDKSFERANAYLAKVKLNMPPLPAEAS